ncbi:MAG: M28 family peptidase, partial [Clostridia bacterium]|nr:M28 family peptidase [Clostridia bacterium]
MKKFTGLIVLITLLITVAVITGIIFSNRSFDVGIYRNGGVFRHIDILTSKEYNGKLTGSEGNWSALRYIENYFRDLGIKPAGENGTYYQKFMTLVPDIDKEPVFIIKDESGGTVIDLTMYKDYKAVTSFNGGGVDFKGELIFVESNLYRLDPALIEDRIVVITAINIKPEYIDYVRDNGGKGILNNADESMYAFSKYHELEKDVSNWTKNGETIFAAYISNKIYQEMLKHANEYESEESIKPLAILENTEIKVDIGFPIKETANIMGKIEGKANNGRYLIISANIDGAGEGTDGRHFPGAISGTNGLALMMETARVIANQSNLPFETIIFAGWNGQKQQFSGSEYYLEHWIYPPDKTTIIHLDDIGYETFEGLKISSESILSGILKDKVSNIAEDLGIKTAKVFPYYSPATRFADYGAEGIMLGDVFYMQDYYYDNSGNTDNRSLQNAAIVLLNFIKRETFRDTFP